MPNQEWRLRWKALVKYTVIAVAMSFIICLFGCGPGGKEDLETMISRSSLIYSCKRKDGHFVVINILKHTIHSPYSVKVEDALVLNYDKLIDKRIPLPVMVVVFVERLDISPKNGMNIGQSEIPVRPDGYLALYSTKYSDLLQRFQAAEK